MKVLEQRRKS